MHIPKQTEHATRCRIEATMGRRMNRLSTYAEHIFDFEGVAVSIFEPAKRTNGKHF